MPSASRWRISAFRHPRSRSSHLERHLSIPLHLNTRKAYTLQREPCPSPLALTVCTRRKERPPPFPTSYTIQPRPQPIGVITAASRHHPDSAAHDSKDGSPHLHQHYIHTTTPTPENLLPLISNTRFRVTKTQRGQPTCASFRTGCYST